MPGTIEFGTESMKRCGHWKPPGAPKMTPTSPTGFPSQAIPALTLARLIKAWKPDVHITMGGGLLAYTAGKLAKQPALWDLIDSMVLLEGERALLHGQVAVLRDRVMCIGRKEQIAAAARGTSSWEALRPVLTSGS